MRDGGALAAAIGVIEEIDRAHLPTRLALKAWGARSRFAGAKDRALVSGLVLDALRHRRSLGWRMGEESPRALALGSLAWLWSWPPERIAAAAADPAHGPGALLGEEEVRLVEPIPLEHAADAVRSDVPDWVQPMMARAFGERAVEEGAALAGRAPIDLRANTLKSDPKRVAAALARFDPRPPGVVPEALRIAAPAAAERAAPVEATPAFEKGWFEVQDLSSQIAVAAAGALAHRQVLDYCAGGGGKTLALAAAMANTGQIFAYDPNQRRLAEVQRRARRAGVRSLQIREPPEGPAGLEERMDLVFVDAPCTGSGAWRRRPDAKW
ncbi:MAG: MFS transporter, partial [Caulobacteraceae bacterium]